VNFGPLSRLEQLAIYFCDFLCTLLTGGELRVSQFGELVAVESV
jgi:hypothetical protein